MPSYWRLRGLEPAGIRERALRELTVLRARLDIKIPRSGRLLVAAWVFHLLGCDPTPPAGSAGVGGGLFDPTGGAGAGAAACHGRQCAPDMRTVVDCDGKPIEDCGPMEACGEGQCYPACEAARVAKSSMGCEYHAVMMDGASGRCFAAIIANTYDAPAHVTAEFEGTKLSLTNHARVPKGSGASLVYEPYDDAEGLAPGGILVLFLGGGGGAVPCPVPAAVPTGAQRKGTGRGSSFRIQTDVPVVAYQMLPYDGGKSMVTGASLLLPTSAWGVNYIAVNAYARSEIGGSDKDPSLNLVASMNDTSVTILPKVAIESGPGVAAASANVAKTYVLQAGEVLQITQALELTGSPIQADKPVGLWAGHQKMTVPVDAYAADHAEQQIPPVGSLGWEYAGVSHRQRSSVAERPRWRIIGAVDDTALTYDPAVPDAPASVDLGTVAEFVAERPFVVRSQGSQHPFLLVTYMTGESTVTPKYGDADFVRIVPSAQYLRRYVFFTDPSYPETNLVVVRRKGVGGFADVTLDCAGELGEWAALGTTGKYEYTRFDLVNNFQPHGDCDNGRHEMLSEQPFGLWVWGWGTPESAGTTSVSYGYPAGENVAAVNDVVVVPTPK